MTDTAAILAWHAYQAGDIDELAALRALTPALDAADRLIAAGEGQRSLWRKRIEEVVRAVGGKAAIDGVAEYRVTEPYKVVTYERSVIEEVLHQLIAAGLDGYAAGLDAARKVSERPGTLRVRPVRTGAPMD